MDSKYQAGTGPARLITAAAAATLLALGGCGGDDGGGGGGGDTAVGTAQTVSGTLTLYDTSGSVTTQAAKAADTDPFARMTSYKADGTEIDATSFPISTQPTGTDNWIFSKQLRFADGGGYVVVEFSRDGFTTYSKRVDFNDPSNIELRAEMHETKQVTATLGTALKSDGSQVPGFRFAVVEMPDGTTKAVGSSNDLLAAKAVGGSEVLSVDIPQDSVPSGTTELTGNFQNFDPTDPDQADNFPGQYADSDGNRLVSVAFDYQEIKTDSGDNLGDAVAAAVAAGTLSKAAAPPTVITREVPANSCPSVKDLGDADDTQTGLQVPVYTYNPNSGIWDQLGMGSVYPEGGTTVVADATSVDCNNTYDLKIEVTNEEFTRKWWNLDYPLTFDQPVELCSTITVQNQDGDPLAGTSVQIYDDDGRSFQEAYGYTDSNGQVRIDSWLIDGSNDRQASLRYWDWNSSGVGAYTSTTFTLGEAPNCTTESVQVQRADTCQVSGNVVDLDTGDPKADQFVWMFGSDTTSNYHYAYASTDTDGDFGASVVCDMDYDLYAGNVFSGTNAAFNVDGTVTPGTDPMAGEASDNGQSVVLEQLSVANLGPYVYVLSDVAEINPGDTITFYVTGFDLEGDYPVDYSVSISTPGGNTLITKTGTLTADEFESGNGDEYQITIPSGGATGLYGASGTATDSKGKTGFVYGGLYVQ